MINYKFEGEDIVDAPVGEPGAEPVNPDEPKKEPEEGEASPDEPAEPSAAE